MSRNQTLTVVIAGDPSSLNRTFAKVGAGAEALEHKIGKVSSGVGRHLVNTGKIASVALGVGLVGALKKSVDAYAEAEGIATQTNTVLASTGAAANISAKGVANLATEISRKSGIDDEAIQSSENLLLTFTKVRNETGKGNDIFNRATQTVADFSVRFKKDLAPSAILVGKALNAPIQGTAALSRVGVQFTKDQKAQIQTLVESGKTLEAQKLILAELETQTRGAADAAGNTFTGKINKAKVAVGNLGEAIGGRVAPILADLADQTAGLVNTLATSDRPATFFNVIGDAANAAKGEVAGIFHAISDKRAGGASLGTSIGESLADAVGDINWRAIGNTISNGISSAIDVGDDIAQAVQDGIGGALGDIDGKQLLSGLLRVVAEGINAVFSPSFWYHNFGSIVSVALAAFPIGKVLGVLKIPGGLLLQTLGRPIYTAIAAVGKGLISRLGRIGGDAVTGFLDGLSRFAPKTANLLLDVVTGSGKWLSGLPGKFRAAGARAINAITSAIGGGIGKIAAAIGNLVGVGIAKAGALTKGFRDNARFAIAALTQGIVDGTGAVAKAAGRLVSRVATGIVDGAGTIANAGITLGKKMVSGIATGIKATIGSVGGVIKKGIGAIGSAVGIGDGIGRQIGKTLNRPPSGAVQGGGGGSLMGANRALGPAVSLGAASGLRTTSGKRATGSKTSSGYPSYHGYGEAVDQAGPPGAMMRYFRAAKAAFKPLGARFAELIYTPGGAGIKNGQPYTYTGTVAADHEDHVHTAFDLGHAGPGIGDGDGRAPGARPPFTGDGIGDAARDARTAGWQGEDGVNIVTIAGRESGYDEEAVNIGPRDHSIGYTQVNQLAHKGRFGTDVQLKNGVVNFRAALALAKASAKAGLDKFFPWKGPSGSWRDGLSAAMFAAARRAFIASRGSGSTPGAGAGGSADASAASKAEADEKKGSRIANAVAAPFDRDSATTTTTGASRGVSLADKVAGRGPRGPGRPIVGRALGITSLGRIERDRDRVISLKDREYSQTASLFDQVLGGQAGAYGEEDLGTSEGRGQRLSEIAELRKLKVAQLGRQQVRLTALTSKINKLAGKIRAGRTQLRKLKGVTAARVRQRIKDWDDQRIEAIAEARSLGGDIADTQLEIGELDIEASEVTATPDTAQQAALDADREARENAGSPADRVGAALGDLDLQAAAGVITPEVAKAKRIALLEAALRGEYGQIDQRQQWTLMAQLREAMEAQTQSTGDLIQALKDVKASIDAQLAFADRVTSITSMEATRALADLITGNLGQRVVGRQSMPGNGITGRL